MSLGAWASRRWFNWVHGNHLIYNTCWEDPRLDRIALEMGPEDNVLVLTSAGCNALDYALAGAGHIHAVDLNPRQNALLELKLAGIRRLEFEQFFQLFGLGNAPEHREYYGRLRGDLSPFAQKFWDRHVDFFAGRGVRNSFYYHGTSGFVAYMMNAYIDSVVKIREAIDAIWDAQTIEQQQEIYYSEIDGVFWNRFAKWLFKRDVSMSLLGVPRTQRELIDRHYDEGVSQFIEECLEAVFALLPLSDNYFWRVYLFGEYSRECCPEYLKEENFQQLKGGLADRVSVHTNSVAGFLEQNDVSISRFVLLDHMDWLSTIKEPWLQQEWQAIVNRATPGARLIWRSGGLQVDYVDPVEVEVKGKRQRVGELLTYNTDQAAELHQRDRVHTYGSFYIADLALA